MNSITPKLLAFMIKLKPKQIWLIIRNAVLLFVPIITILTATFATVYFGIKVLIEK
jgi:hypothetical protein